jgi:hypothetical protein
VPRLFCTSDPEESSNAVCQFRCTLFILLSWSETETYFTTWYRSATCARAGVPETANDERRGINETISLCLGPHQPPF